MKKRTKRILAVIGALFLLGLGVWLNNTSLFVRGEGGAKLLAHRGLAQTFQVKGVEWDTNTAEIIYPPEHDFLENTIDSMRAACDMGADVVEFDIRRTKDDQLAVFHDYELSYRTDGRGAVEEYTMAQLKALDVGYGYTADGGATYPFRGKGVGKMPEIAEVLSTFPEQELLIHIKDEGEKCGQLLWQHLSAMSDDRLAQITVYGADESIQYLRRQRGDLRVLSTPMLKSALIQYLATGWTGHIPASLHNMELHLPINYARLLWGWPHRFLERMDRVNTRVVIVGGDGGASEGIDTSDDWATIPEDYSGYIWTNRIDRYADKKIDGFR